MTQVLRCCGAICEVRQTSSVRMKITGIAMPLAGRKGAEPTATGGGQPPHPRDICARMNREDQD